MKRHDPTRLDIRRPEQKIAMNTFVLVTGVDEKSVYRIFPEPDDFVGVTLERADNVPHAGTTYIALESLIQAMAHFVGQRSVVLRLVFRILIGAKGIHAEQPRVG